MTPDSPATTRRDSAVDRAAATWYARRDAGLTAPEQAEFERWLATDSRHAAAYAEFDESLSVLDSAPGSELAQTMIEALAVRHQRRRRRRAGGFAAIALATAACAVFLFRTSLPPPMTETASPAPAVVVIKPETRHLPDGTVVDLKPGAIIEVDYTAARRGVRLGQGEAHFAVVRDPGRPFVVNARGVEVRAVGTAFSVEANPDTVQVVVTSGRVAVERLVRTNALPEAIPMTPVYAGAGCQVLVPLAAAVAQVTPLLPEEIDRELGWRGPRMELSGTPLADAVAAFNRENRVQLSIADSALAGVRMSGVFRADRGEDFARMLERHYGVRLQRDENVITLRAGQPP